MDKDEALVAIRHAVNKGYSAAPPYNQLFEAVREVKDILDEQARTERASEAAEQPVIADQETDIETLNALWRGSVVLVRSTIDATHAWTKESQSYVNEEGIHVSDQWVAPGMFFASSERLLNRRGNVTFEILYDPSLTNS